MFPSLSSTRRKRPVPADWASEESISSFDTIQATDALYPGARALAVNGSGDTALIGSADGVLGIFSISEQKVTAALKSGSGAVTAALWWESKPIIATAAGSVKAYGDAASNAEAFELGSHAGRATSVALHPSGQILASTGEDKTYKLYDLASMKVVTQVLTPSGKQNWMRWSSSRR
jgi:pre-mRNA-processing factor 19